MINKLHLKNKKKTNTPEERRKRSLRNLARLKLAKKMGVSPKDIKGDVDHRIPLQKNDLNETSNLRVLTKKQNRGRKRLPKPITF
jgi:hypothetical protein